MQDFAYLMEKLANMEAAAPARREDGDAVAATFNVDGLFDHIRTTPS